MIVRTAVNSVIGLLQHRTAAQGCNAVINLVIDIIHTTQPRGLRSGHESQNDPLPDQQCGSIIREV